MGDGRLTSSEWGWLRKSLTEFLNYILPQGIRQPESSNLQVLNRVRARPYSIHTRSGFVGLAGTVANLGPGFLRDLLDGESAWFVKTERGWLVLRTQVKVARLSSKHPTFARVGVLSVPGIDSFLSGPSHLSSS